MKYNIGSEKEAKEVVRNITKSYAADPTKFVEFADFVERNSYRYSYKNTLLIKLQNNGAIMCQSFGAWKKKGAMVLKGQKGMKVWTPTPYTMVDTSGDETYKTPLSKLTPEQKKKYEAGEYKSRKGMSFKLGSTFDIAQTDVPAEKYPEILSRGSESKDHAKAFEALRKFAEDSGIPVVFGDAESEINGAALFGYYSPSTNEIHLARNLKDTQLLSVGSHELGHALMHNNAPNKDTEQKEIEADIFSILLDRHFGLEVEETRKAHLKASFDSLKVVKPADSKLTDAEYRDKHIEDTFSNVLAVYREAAEKIDKNIKKGGA